MAGDGRGVAGGSRQGSRAPNVASLALAALEAARAVGNRILDPLEQALRAACGAPSPSAGRPASKTPFDPRLFEGVLTTASAQLRQRDERIRELEGRLGELEGRTAAYFAAAQAAPLVPEQDASTARVASLEEELRGKAAALAAAEKRHGELRAQMDTVAQEFAQAENEWDAMNSELKKENEELRRQLGL